MSYPYRECFCGRQIHTGGVSMCDSCFDMPIEKQELMMKTEKELLVDILLKLNPAPSGSGEKEKE